MRCYLLIEVRFKTSVTEVGFSSYSLSCFVLLFFSHSVANYPLGLGTNRISILVTSDSQSIHDIVSIYKIIIYREDRPSLPLFDDFMVCAFVQVLLNYFKNWATFTCSADLVFSLAFAAVVIWFASASLYFSILNCSESFYNFMIRIILMCTKMIAVWLILYCLQHLT